MHLLYRGRREFVTCITKSDPLSLSLRSRRRQWARIPHSYACKRGQNSDMHLESFPSACISTQGGIVNQSFTLNTSRRCVARVYRKFSTGAPKD